jgi:hypothetical protein
MRSRSESALKLRAEDDVMRWPTAARNSKGWAADLADESVKAGELEGPVKVRVRRK